MGWIKRNLYFVIGSFVALVVMGLAGWYFYSKYALNDEIKAKIDEQNAELKRLNNQNPHPGEPGKVDNIQAAKEQQKELRAYLRKTHPYFQQIPPIPDLPKLTDRDFSGALSRTLDQLQKEAASGSVSLPPKYSFSFDAQRQRVSFAAGSLGPLAAQLGEVKAICDVLFQAKINSLDNLRRESISEDDVNGAQAATDYLPRKSSTNELAVISPYDMTFRCFSSELAAVLSGFGSSHAGMVVRTVKVELAPEEAPASPIVGQPAMQPVFVQASPPPPVVAPNPTAEQDAFNRRYGVGPSGPGAFRPTPTPTPYPTPAYAPPAASATTPGGANSRGGLPTVLDEKPLKVTLALDIVKLLPSK